MNYKFILFYSILFRDGMIQIQGMKKGTTGIKTNIINRMDKFHNIITYNNISLKLVKNLI